MSFGRPPTYSSFKVAPPDRGSFPLDHDGECKAVMMDYMKCMRANKMDNGKCRHLSQSYLQCRMDNGLMEMDEMSNLGFHPEDTDAAKSQSTSAAQGEGAPAPALAPLISTSAEVPSAKQGDPGTQQDNARRARIV